MDELEILKRDWNKDNNRYPKLTYDEIYKMILKKSSSVVKWIFIISLLEFAFWIGISFTIKGTSISEKINSLNIDHILMPLTLISYFILIYFFYKFYKNYRNISTTDDSKTLMENIIKTRKTVKHYVVFNLVSVVIGTFLAGAYGLKNDPNFENKLQMASANGDVFKIYAGLVIVTILMLAVALLLLLLFYWLIYGILLKRLNKNYNELKKLEV